MTMLQQIFGRTDGTLDVAKIVGVIGFIAIISFQGYALYMGQIIDINAFGTALSVWGASVASWIRVCSRTRKGTLTGNKDNN